MKNLIARIFSGRVRYLERELDRMSTDLDAFQAGEFRKVSITQMTYTPETGLQCLFEANVGKLLGAWAMNTLDAVNATNYIEFQVRGPDHDPILITLQRVNGETPGAKAARLERELQSLKLVSEQR